jgi:hypothetical protein
MHLFCGLAVVLQREKLLLVVLEILHKLEDVVVLNFEQWLD